MGRPASFRDILGYFKDKASITKATLLSKPDSLSPLPAVLRATTHDPATPPRDRHLNSLLSLGHGSRLTAAACIETLMDRLHTTRNSSVALKCLISIHHIIRSGSFILQDQLSIYPYAGGRNYLNLSNFRDESNPVAWQLSVWVRWYARVLEQMLYVSRVLGAFHSQTSCTTDEMVAALSNGDLVKEIDALVGVVEDIGKVPEYAYFTENRLVGEVMKLAGEESVLTQKEILLRVKETRERLGCLSFGESVELVCVLKRLEDCKQRVLFLCSIEEKSKLVGGDVLLNLVGEIKEKIGIVEERGDGRTLKGRGIESESARLFERVVTSRDSIHFPSGRIVTVLNRFG
ncbi:putative clathrin assembly protein At4g40080 [Aristolochia californica]|uniref:putative clathrin assembly protein At4g40080 n=1 Tax=Aristolochia californica TaxID=171875 RepID=UPI0035E28817